MLPRTRQDCPNGPTIAYIVKTSTDSPIVSMNSSRGSATAHRNLVAASLIVHPLYLTGRAQCSMRCGPAGAAVAAIDSGAFGGRRPVPPHARAGRQRGVYDELHEAELTAFWFRGRAFDIIVLADVLCYFGRLEPALRAAHDAVLSGGLLCFSSRRWRKPRRESHSSLDSTAVIRIPAVSRTSHERRRLRPPGIDAVVLRQNWPAGQGLLVSSRCAPGESQLRARLQARLQAGDA